MGLWQVVLWYQVTRTTPDTACPEIGGNLATVHTGASFGAWKVPTLWHSSAAKQGIQWSMASTEQFPGRCSSLSVSNAELGRGSRYILYSTDITTLASLVSSPTTLFDHWSPLITAAIVYRTNMFQHFSPSWPGVPRVASRALSVAAICEVRRRILYILLKFSSIVFVKYHVCFLFAQHFDQIELMFVEL